MKRLWSLLGSLLLLNTVAGCCSVGPLVGNNDPLAMELAGGGCCLTKHFNKCKKHKHGCGCQPGFGYDVFPSYDGGCGDLGCGVGMMDGGFAYGTPAASSCGCGMPHPTPTPNYAPAPNYAPTPNVVPAAPAYDSVPPVPAAAPAAPGPGIEPVPMPEPVPAVPDANGQNTQYGNPGVPTQNVSMEEFHRLPGTIISGPSTGAPTAPQFAPPVPVRQAIPTAAQPGVRPANWQPTRTY